MSRIPLNDEVLDPFEDDLDDNFLDYDDSYLELDFDDLTEEEQRELDEFLESIDADMIEIGFDEDEFDDLDDLKYPE